MLFRQFQNWLVVRFEHIFRGYRVYHLQDSGSGKLMVIHSVVGGKPGPIDLRPPKKRTAIEKKKQVIEERKIQNERVITEYKLRKLGVSPSSRPPAGK